MNIKVLIIAEAANPEWASVPLVGWSLANAISKILRTHIVTHIRNRESILKIGLHPGTELTTIDSERVAKPLWKISKFIRGNSGVGWTTNTAISAFSYYYFEHLVWKTFKQRILEGEFDVIHRITPLSPTIPSTLAKKCKAAGIPFIVGPLNGGVPWPKYFNLERKKEQEWLSYIRSAYKLLPGHKSMLANSTAIIVGSKDTLKQIPERYRNKCIYLPENAVDPKKFKPIKNTKRSEFLRACFVGRLVPYKGPDILLEAIAPHIKNGLLKLDIIGDGPLRNELEKFCNKEGIIDSVKFYGWINHADVHRIMNQSNLLTFPSIREFGGGVVLEAMAIGLVPVVIDYAGPGELVNSSVGFKIPIGDRAKIVRDLESLLLMICNNSEQLESMSKNSQERVQNFFTWDAKAIQVKEIYQWVRQESKQKPEFFL